MWERVWESPGEVSGPVGEGTFAHSRDRAGKQGRVLMEAVPREARQGRGHRGPLQVGLGVCSRGRTCKGPEDPRDSPRLNAGPTIRSGPQIHRLPFPTEPLSPISLGRS